MPACGAHRVGRYYCPTSGTIGIYAFFRLNARASKPAFRVHVISRIGGFLPSLPRAGHYTPHRLSHSKWWFGAPGHNSDHEPGEDSPTCRNVYVLAQDRNNRIRGKVPFVCKFLPIISSLGQVMEVKTGSTRETFGDKFAGVLYLSLVRIIAVTAVKIRGRPDFWRTTTTSSFLAQRQ